MREHPGTRPAVIRSDTGRTLTHGEFARRSVQLAGLLRARGLGDGDRVAILLENDIEWLISAWGVRRANMLFVPVNWHLTSSEAGYIMANSDSRAVITSVRLLPVAEDAIRSIDKLALRVSVGGGAGFEDFDEAIGRMPDRPVGVELDGSSIVYSSGTTGKPKGVLRQPTGAPFGTPNSLETLLQDQYAIDDATVYLSPAPLYHAAPVGWTGAVLNAGGSVVVMPSFDAEAALVAIERHRVTHAQFVPTHFVRMLRLSDEIRGRYDLSSLTHVVHAAAPCSPTVKRQMIEWLGPIVHEYYAGSERCGITQIDSRQWLEHPGSVGRSATGAVHILDIDSGEELPPGEVGLIYFENPVPFEYHKDAEKTAATFTAQGWGTYGDMGSVDDDGYLYLADRRSDLIISGGVNIYPQEVENVLTEHPAVADAAVIGVPNEEFGKEVKAIVQLLPSAERPSEEDLIAFCRQRMAGFKSPRSIDFVELLPRLPSGKLLRRELVLQRGSERSNERGPV